ncbi:MAG: AAA-associated domain-containing protein [Caldilineaceae bacterium]|nr:AAA-associated domain-containing protein [Caldilineaceae bacterium]
MLLHVNQVSMAYGSGARRFVAIEDVTLSLQEGEFMALLGPSGCGKSTLLRIIAGLQTATAGEVLYRGQPLRGVNPHATIVFQTFALFPWFTVLENVALALKAKGIPAAERAVRAEEAIDRVGLDGFESAYPRELSGGMRQKVGFARAIVNEPELLCLDEPFSALDILSAEALRGELLELWTGKLIPTKAILMVSHNIEEAVFMADRIVIMDKNPGRIIADLPVPLAHPRQRKAAEFQALVDQVYAILAGQTQPEAVEIGTAPGEPGPTRRLPRVVISDLAALLERLTTAPRMQADIYRLAEELGPDSDDLLNLVEAAELLGFATVQAGDITLTALGETFAEASILARKEIFASRIQRLPVFQWALGLIQAARAQALDWDVIQAALASEFPPPEAARQLETIVNWGRYAELLAYDDDSAVLSLDADTA